MIWFSSWTWKCGILPCTPGSPVWGSLGVWVVGPPDMGCIVKRELSQKKKFFTIRSDPHLWSQALGSDQKNKIVGTSGWNELRMNGWMDGWMDGCTSLYLHRKQYYKVGFSESKIILNLSYWESSSVLEPVSLQTPPVHQRPAGNLLLYYLRWTNK